MSANPTFEPTEAAQAGDAPGPLSATAPAFLLACAGSGASVLAGVLDSHPAIRVLEDPGGPWSSLPPGPGGSDRLTAEHATPELTESLRRWAVEQTEGSMPLLSDPRNSLRVPFLRTVFPEAKFVHLVRDGRDVARALMVDLGGDDWAALKPPRWRELRDGAAGYLRCALAWREIVETTLADLGELSHALVRFEDVMESPDEAAERVSAALGLSDPEWSREAFARAPAIARELPNAQRYTVRRWRAVAVERLFELRAVNVLIGDLLERLGYDAAPEELAQPADAQLPRSVLLELRRLQRMVDERDARIAELGQELAELRHAHGVEKRAAEHASAALAAADRRASTAARSGNDERERLKQQAADLEAGRKSATELAEALRGERQRLLDEQERLLEERSGLEESLDSAATAMRRTVESSSWRLGHRLTRLAATLLGRKPGRDSALDSALDDMERARARRRA
jgi:Sulfotransferase family